MLRIDEVQLTRATVGELESAALPALRAIRGSKIAMVYQEPMASLHALEQTGARVERPRDVLDERVERRVVIGRARDALRDARQVVNGGVTLRQWAPPSAVTRTASWTCARSLPGGPTAQPRSGVIILNGVPV